jgi:uncharacterized protein (TIGR00251 family)
MKDQPAWYQWKDDDLLLSVRVQPKASRDEIIGPLEDALKIRITAPPVEGKANNHLIRFLARTFGVSKSRVEIISGETGRLKRLRIHAPERLPPGILHNN